MVFLSLLTLFGLLPTEAKQVELTVGTIYSGEQSLNRGTWDNTNHWTGYQTYIRNLSISLKDHDLSNLYLVGRFYIENNTKADSINIVGNCNEFLEVSNAQYQGNVAGSNGSAFHPNGLKLGWNEFRISLANNKYLANPDTVKWFRLCFAHLKDSCDYKMKLADVRIVDASMTEDDGEPTDTVGKVPHAIATIYDKTQLNSNQDATSNWWGYQTYTRTAGVSLKGHALKNLYLQMDYYVENFDHPGDVSFIKQTNPGLVNLVELAKELKGSQYVACTTWHVPDTIKAGWNRLRFPLSDIAKNCDPDTIATFNWFRFCFGHIVTNDAYRMRLKDVKIVDWSDWRTPSEETTSYDDSTYEAASIGFKMDKDLTIANGISNAYTISPAIDVSHHDPSQLYLQFDADITEGTAGDVKILSQIPGQIELTSSGKPDNEEISIGIDKVSWEAGKHTYLIPLSNMSGTINYANINYMRFYGVHVPSTYTGSLHVTLDNVKILDFTTVTKLPTIFSDNMMFQQKKPINIWGYATADKKISVKLYKKDAEIASQDATMDESGKWTVTFPAHDASYDTYKLEVYENGKLFQTVNNILVGEVWVAGGQSNMALSVSVTQDAEDIYKNCNNDKIRVYIEPTKPTGDISPMTPGKDIKGAYWGTGATATDIAKVSGVAYSMVKELQKKLNIPVGFLYTPIGGSVIEAWLPLDEVKADEDLKNKLDRLNLYYTEDFWVNNATTTSGFYNAKIGPLKGYNVAGTIWYQGESNSGRPELYASEINHLYKSWSKTFGFDEGKMPFVFTQVACWPTNVNTPQFLGHLADAMYDGWKLIDSDNCGMLAIYDTDLSYWIKINNNADPIHPTNKTPIGKRFATAVYNLVYGKSGEYTCAVPENVEAEGKKITVTFSHVGNGLITKDGSNSVHGFEIAGDDGVYAGAMAKIVGKDKVEVWSPIVKDPKKVAYAFNTYSNGSNLMNADSIPAAPFRSDRSDNQKFYNPQDWTWAECDSVWAWDNGTTVYKKNVGWLPSWTAADGTTISFDKSVKSEGVASIKAAYTASADVAPVTRYNSTKLQLANFKAMAVDVKNGDARKKTLNVKLTTSDGKTLYATADKLKDAEVAVADTFQTIVLSLENLVDETNTTVSDAATELAKVSAIDFIVNDTEAGTVYLDNVLFGNTTEKQISTGINNINVENDSTKSDVYYDLQGRRVSNPKQGVYIRGHHKVVIK